MMTEQEMRVAIAEACGWKRHKTQFGYEWEDPEGRRGFVRRHEDRGGDYLVSAPDYLNDLNAMHVVEQELKSKHGHKSVGNLHRNYLLHLMNVMNPGVELWDNGTYLGDWTHAIKTAEATAKQRAEAMCRTLFPERFKE